MNLLTGKTAVVTGGARGIGAAMAKGFAREGAKVVVLDIDGAAAKATAEEIAAAGAAASSAAIDVSDRDAVMRLGACLTDEYGAIHVLVNNAGIAPRVLVDDPELPAKWDQVISVNLNGQFNVTVALLPALKKEGASIIFTASIAGVIAPRSSAAYGAAKAGLISLTKFLARDLAEHNIRVNAIAPGVISTDMTANTPGGVSGAKHLERVPMKRNGEPHELAGPAIFLASDMSSYVTGVTLPVDGGFLAV